MFDLSAEIDSALRLVDLVIEDAARDAIYAIQSHGIDLRASMSAARGKSFNRSRGQYLRHARVLRRLAREEGSP